MWGEGNARHGSSGYPACRPAGAPPSFCGVSGGANVDKKHGKAYCPTGAQLNDFIRRIGEIFPRQPPAEGLRDCDRSPASFDFDELRPTLEDRGGLLSHSHGTGKCAV